MPSAAKSTEAEIGEGLAATAFMRPRPSLSREPLGRGPRQDLRSVLPEQHRVGEEEVAATGPHEPGEDVKAHPRPDLEIAVAAQARHSVAAGPARRAADADDVAAMMAPVMRE